MYENQPTKTSVVMQHIKVQSFCAFEDKPPKNISCRYLKNQSSYINLYIYIYTTPWKEKQIMFWIFTICFLENIWKTDLDFMVPYRNRLQILHVLTGGTINASLTTTQAPYHHPAAKIREYLDGNYSQNPKLIYI